MWLAADTGGDLPLSGLANYGLAGIILAVLFTFAWWVVKRLWDRVDKLEEKKDALEEAFRTQYVPSLEATKDALEEIVPLLIVLRDRDKRRS